MKKNDRGLKVYSDIKDTLGKHVYMQDSSSTMQECVWIFCKYPDGSEAKEHRGELVSATPHLNKAQARRLGKALLKWADK